jgi:hypothetical protein
MRGNRPLSKDALRGPLATSVLVSAVGLALSPQPEQLDAVSPREAPPIADAPLADITEVVFMRSYETGSTDRAVHMMDVVPGGEPSSGPDPLGFGDDALYTIHVDNGGGGQTEDVVFDDGDTSGRPDGRRPIDDVADVAVRVVGGPSYATAGDGFDANGRPLLAVFPLLSSP